MAISGGGFFPGTLTLTSIDPAVVSDDGGDIVAITGQFPPGDLAVEVDIGGGVFVPCYSGRSGSGNAGPGESGTCLTFVVPPLVRGGPYALRVTQGVLQAGLAAALTARNRSFQSRTYTLRSVFPPALASGPQALNLTDPLAVVDVVPEPALSVLPVATPQPLPLNSPFSFVPTINNPGGMPLTVTNVGTPLPANLALNPSTGEISGTPLAVDLLTDNGDQAGSFEVQLNISDGVNVAQTNVFRLDVQGACLFAPLMGFSFDDADLSAGNPDDIVGANDGTTVGAVTTGVAGTVAEQFDFGGGYVQIADSPTFDGHTGANGTMTLTGIFTADAPHGAQEMIASKCDPATSGNREFDLIRDAAGTVTMLLQHPGGASGTDGIAITSTSLFPLDTPTSLVVTYDVNGGAAITDKLKMYFDGVPQAVTTGTFGSFTQMTSGSAPFVIGETDITGNAPPNNPIDGKLDEFFYFASQVANHALSSDQAATLGWLALTAVSVKTWVAIAPCP